MTAVEKLVTDHLDLWTTAIKRKSAAGRGSSSKLELYGIKKLRELILQLAVHGLLVPQDPNDEPASELIKKITAKKALLIKEGKIKTEMALPPITAEDKPFDLPDSWTWQHLADVFYPISVGKNKVKTSELSDHGKYPVVDQGQSFVAGYVNDDDLVNVLPGPVILFGDHTSALKYIDFDFVAGADGVKILRPICCDERFFFLVCKTLPIESRGYGRHYSRLVDNFFPLPPLAEQHRIVDRVDEMMTLCDELEQRTNTNVDAYQTLIEAVLNALTSAANHTHLARAWDRIVSHFDTLFTTEDSVDQLKQTILRLAVMGKLISQDQNDESASELLKKIAAEKAFLVKEGKIKPEKPLPPIGDEEKPFELPRGWEWCRLDALTLHSEAGWSPKCEETPRVGDNWGVLKVSAVTWGSFNPDENKALPANLEPIQEYEVKPGDFLISRANTADLVARSVIVNENAPKKLMMSDKIIRFAFSRHTCPRYLSIFNNGSFARKYYLRAAGGTSSSMKNVSRLQIQSLTVPLPPLAEQQRIVAKVDELMMMCDQLKRLLNDAQTTQLRFADAIVEKALARA